MLSAPHPHGCDVAGHRAHRWEAILHVGLPQVPRSCRHDERAERPRKKAGYHRRPPYQEGLQLCLLPGEQGPG